jgi:hypothetical protein
MTTGNFFQIDQRTWSRVCDQDMNSAVAYLILGCFSGGNNRKTAASVHAIETYTGISRSRAQKAINTLIEAGLIIKTQGGSSPRYDLIPYCELPAHSNSGRKPITDKQHAIFELVKNGDQPQGRQRIIAHNLVKKGWLKESMNCIFSITINVKEDKEPDWIWLPKELIMGAVNETPPVERIRQTQDAMTLRLFVDLYHAQNLREDGGISREFVYESYKRVKVGEQAQYVVWGFKKESQWVSWNDAIMCHKRDRLTEEEKKAGGNPGIDFFRRMGQLVSTGLIEWIPYLFDSDTIDAEPIHPYRLGYSDCLEDQIGFSAYEAGAKLLSDDQIKRAQNDHLWLAPVPRHFSNVQMIGIARLRYRPKTKLTGAWWSELHEKGAKYLVQYRRIAKGEAGAMTAYNLAI